MERRNQLAASALLSTAAAGSFVLGIKTGFDVDKASDATRISYCLDQQPTATVVDQVLQDCLHDKSDRIGQSQFADNQAITDVVARRDELAADAAPLGDGKAANVVALGGITLSLATGLAAAYCAIAAKENYQPFAKED